MLYFFCVIRSSQDREPVFIPFGTLHVFPGHPNMTQPQQSTSSEVQVSGVWEKTKDSQNSLMRNNSEWVLPSYFKYYGGLSCHHFYLISQRRIMEEQKEIQKQENMCWQYFSSKTTRVNILAYVLPVYQQLCHIICTFCSASFTQYIKHFPVSSRFLYKHYIQSIKHYIEPRSLTSIHHQAHCLSYVSIINKSTKNIFVCKSLSVFSHISSGWSFRRGIFGLLVDFICFLLAYHLIPLYCYHF